jgi:hypothetical protein
MTRREGQTLKKAHEARQTVRVNCQLCNIRRYYDPSDLEQLCGDIPVERVRMRCNGCGKTDYIAVSLFIPGAEERQGIRIRRLAEIRMVRKVIWQDEP